MAMMKSAAQAELDAAPFKFPHHKRQIPFRNLKWESGTRIKNFSSAHDFPKFAKVGAAVEQNFGKWILEWPYA